MVRGPGQSPTWNRSVSGRFGRLRLGGCRQDLDGGLPPIRAGLEGLAFVGAGRRDVVLAVDRLAGVAGLVEREHGAAFEAEDTELMAAALFGDPAHGGGHGGAVNHGPRRIVHSGAWGNRVVGWAGGREELVAE